MKTKRKLKSKTVLMAQQDRCCFWCGCKVGKDATLDHLVPKSRFGPDARSNLVVACWPCNSRRGDTDAMEFAQTCDPSRVKQLQFIIQTLKTP